MISSFPQNAICANAKIASMIRYNMVFFNNDSNRDAILLVYIQIPEKQDKV